MARLLPPVEIRVGQIWAQSSPRRRYEITCVMGELPHPAGAPHVHVEGEDGETGRAETLPAALFSEGKLRLYRHAPGSV